MLLSNVDRAIPAVRSWAECANYSLAVSPYLSQLRSLPQEFFQSLSSLEKLHTFYISSNPFVLGLAFALAVSPLFLIVSEINKNYSQVDRLWSILPSIYTFHYAAWARLSGVGSQRLDALFACTLLWTVRLTFNYWRRGGYSVGSEDYRWEILREKINPTLFFVFNIVFISFAQNILLFIVTSPAYVLLLTSHLNGGQMTAVDTAYASVMAVIVCVEALADQQQWNYQETKKEYKKTGKVPSGFNRKDLDRGFNWSGLWAYSRHPNFACEIAFWVSLYQWGCLMTLSMLNWSAVGALSYVILFQGSTAFTESITASKYPEYTKYQEQVGRFVPKLF